ncbi:MAG: Unknown protein [uncultured Sulfurovum sp.]|uniref:SPOR domain-containing protein n=1 Tax=uncultured Sulfurovum sp. TaxID=269237 RepID=A0A6S6SFE4_9BACT|nr:MAG: Unknown protein [uncultured Sulfurovum sp.]
MADKNLHDIKIDELDSPKKTPLKNILTLLALLFIILVISVVITKLILNTDEGSSIENNDSKSALLNDVEDANKTSDFEEDTNKNESIKEIIPVISSNIIERNLTSAIKTPLTSHEPKEMRTYKDPKQNNTPTEIKKVPKVINDTPKVSTPVRTNVSRNVISEPKPKKEYIDKVVVKKESVPSKTSAIPKNVSFLGGQQKAITHSYYIKVGTYRDATTILNKVKKNNFNYSLVKVENDTTLTRVLVGPFFSRNQAKTQLDKVQANILAGAYITKAK